MYPGTSTGFLVEAFQICQLTVMIAIVRENNAITRITRAINAMAITELQSPLAILSFLMNTMKCQTGHIHLNVSDLVVIVINSHHNFNLDLVEPDYRILGSNDNS